MSKSSQALNTYVSNDSVSVYERMEVVICFNKHFKSCGSLFDSVKPCTDLPMYSGQSFNFISFSVQEVHKALKGLDPRKSLGPEFIDPHFLKMRSLLHTFLTLQWR